jgi:enoyl-CoA hydratase/carnithine racemase
MIVETRAGAVATVVMNDAPSRNAISIPMRLALLDTFRRLEADAAVRAVVLTGGQSYFSVGGDINAMNDPTMSEALERMRIVHDLTRLIAQSAKPVICAVEGWIVGGGLSLSQLCDTVVAGESAKFKAGFSELGLVPDMGILHTLPARVGSGRARQILMYNETFTAKQAAQWGAVDWVVPDGTAIEKAADLAGTLARKAPLPISAMKLAFACDLEGMLTRERQAQAMMVNSADHKEGKAAFREKRSADFRGA